MLIQWSVHKPNIISQLTQFIPGHYSKCFASENYSETFYWALSVEHQLALPPNWDSNRRVLHDVNKRKGERPEASEESRLFNVNVEMVETEAK